MKNALIAGGILLILPFIIVGCFLWGAIWGMVETLKEK